jgi:hypothetical protein
MFESRQGWRADGARSKETRKLPNKAAVRVERPRSGKSTVVDGETQASGTGPVVTHGDWCSTRAQSSSSSSGTVKATPPATARGVGSGPACESCAAPPGAEEQCSPGFDFGDCTCDICGTRHGRGKRAPYDWNGHVHGEHHMLMLIRKEQGQQGVDKYNAEHGSRWAFCKQCWRFSEHPDEHGTSKRHLKTNGAHRQAEVEACKKQQVPFSWVKPLFSCVCLVGDPHR